MARCYKVLMGSEHKLIASCTSPEAMNAVCRLFKDEVLTGLFIHHREGDRWVHWQRVQLSTSEKVQHG